LLQQPLEAVVGRPLNAVWPALDQPRARDVLSAAMHGAPGHLGGLSVGAADGTGRMATVSLIPIGDRATGPRGVMVVAQDVSEQLRLEAELRERHADALDARDRLRTVVEIVSHELRTPLTSVLGYAQLLAERPDADESQRARWVGLIVEKSRLMARLVGEVADLARLGADRMEIRAVPTDLVALLERAAREAAAASPEHDVVVTATGDVPRVSVDPERIQQVFGNLLTNAIKFWPGGGTVEVRIWPSERTVRVDVIDRGAGVPPDAVPRIFDAFYRGSEGVRGSGLGLAVAKGIVEAHGGQVVYASNPDGGSIFAVVLPVAREG
jgi:signal transduction histidine kinase